MTRQTFYRALRKIAKQYKWEKAKWGFVSCNNDEREEPLCFITAVYQARTSKNARMYQYKTIGVKLGLSPSDTKLIGFAATYFTDQHIMEDANYKQDIPKGYKIARRTLLKAVGLDSDV
jgi:hypothetical protein